MIKTCKICDEKLPIESKFCSKCGTSFSETTPNLKQQPVSNKKQTKQLSLIIILILVLGTGFWFFNRNPIQGEWVGEDNDIGITISGKKIEMKREIQNNMKVSISGSLQKKEKNSFVFPIIDSTLSIRMLDVANNTEDFNDKIKELKEEIQNQDFSKNEEKIAKKIINSIEKSGNDVIFKMDVREYNQIIKNNLDDFLDLGDFSQTEIYLVKQDSTHLFMGLQGEDDSLILSKKIK